MKKLLFLVFILAFAMQGEAQQESLHTHVFDNHYWQNPAAAGASDYHKVRFNYRMQWVRMFGSPKTATRSYNGAFRRVGLGARVEYDEIASFRRVAAEVAYAYHIPLSKKLRLSLGLNLKYANWRLANVNDLGLVNVSDIAVVDGQQGAHAFDVGAGAYLYTDKLFVGFSVINLIEWKLNFAGKNEDSKSKLSRQFQAMAGYRFDLGKVSLAPSAYFRMVYGAPPQVDINVRLGLMNEQVFTGLTYRTTQDFALFLGFQISEMFYIVYSYDFSVSPVQRYTSGSHEVTVGVNFKAKKEVPKKEMSSEAEG